MPRLIWALVDDRPGTATQVLGIAGQLAKDGNELAIKLIRYNRLSFLPNILKGRFFPCLDKASMAQLAPPLPDIVIAAGRRAAPALLWIKHQKPACFTVQVMHPDMNLQHFDAVVLPKHDQPPTLPNVISTLGAPHRWTKEGLAKAVDKHKETLDSLPRPYTAVLIGGNTKYGELMEADILRLCGKLANMIGEGSLLVTTSRRTPSKLVSLLKEKLPSPYWLHTAEETGENPYPAFLGAADRIIVTADSISMISEACIRGVPVYAFSPEYTMSQKHQRALAMFEREALVRPLAQYDAEWQGSKILDESARISAIIHERLA